MKIYLKKKNQFRGGFKGTARGVCALPIFCNPFEELETLLFEVELVINNET